MLTLTTSTRQRVSRTLGERICVLAAAAAFFTLCAGGLRGGETARVGLALPTQQEERWVRDLHAMRAAAREQGVDLRVVVARNNQELQNRQVEGLLEQGIEALILAPHDGAGAAPMVDRVRAAGVKVIAYDRLVLGTEVDLYISFDNVRVGELMGEWLVRRAPRGRYVVMSGAPTDNNAKLFKQGHMKAIQPLVDAGDITIVADEAVVDWRPANAQRIVEDALKLSGNGVDAVLAPNDGTAAGAIVALEAAGLAGKVPVTGMDGERSAARRVVAGTQSITVLKDTRKLGEAAVRLAAKLAAGGDAAAETGGATVDNGRIAVPSVLLDAEIVDRDNIDRVLIESGYLTREQVYGK